MAKAKQKIYISFFNARVTSIISIALVLFVLGVVAFMSILASGISRYVKENIGFSIVLSEDMKDADIQRLTNRIEKSRYAKEANFISKESALKVLVDDLGENPEGFLGFNPLQPSIEIKLKAAYARPDSVRWIESQLKSYSGVRDVTYQKDLMQLVNDNVKRIGALLLGLAVILMVISFALISNTIRLTAYSKRFLIHTMKLVGATPAFIRRPFIIDNIVNGIVASVIAVGLLTAGVYYLAAEIDNFTVIMNLPALLSVYLIVFVLGILLTAVSAYFAVNRYIRMKQDALYYV